MPTATDTSAPPLWFRLPPGYYDLAAFDTADFDMVAGVVLPSILGTEEAVERSMNELGVAVSLLVAMRDQADAHTSIGLHPDGNDGASISLFSLSVTRIEPRTPALAAAQTALSITDSPTWSTNTVKQVELPIGMPAVLISGLLAAPPTDLLEHAEIDAPPCEVFQARLAVPFPTGGHIAVADLTSAATRHSESYTTILECIAQTMAFSPPAPLAVPSRRPSRLLELFQ
ncbi:hypothetical protein [Streptomyces sp. NPDC002889]|uniref:hypothetical protein n=1 Tax=Streptomyces sp. NPDC002889 TaxID=3364669 RepID=UPI00369AB018